MPTVTNIQQQKNDASRYSIYVDGEFAFALSANGLLDSGLHQNMELSDQELADIRANADAGRAYDQALNYISLRKRTGKEVCDYLGRKDYGRGLIERTVERLAELGFIDDLDFAESFIRDRQLLRPRSRRRLAAELRQKGADGDTIERALAEVGEDDELQALRQVINKKRTRYSDQSKLIQYLGSQGFSYDLIKKVLSED